MIQLLLSVTDVTFSLALPQDKELASLHEEVTKSQNEASERSREADSLREENEELNRSITDLDQEHEVIVSQLIRQRDELKKRNQSLTDEVVTRRLQTSCLSPSFHVNIKPIPNR